MSALDFAEGVSRQVSARGRTFIQSDQAAIRVREVRYRGLMEITAQIVAVFTRSNLWMARRRSMGRG